MPTNLSGRDRSILNELFRELTEAISAGDIIGDVTHLIPPGSIADAMLASTFLKDQNSVIQVNHLSAAVLSLLSGITSAFSVHMNSVDQNVLAGHTKINITTADFDKGSDYDLTTNYRYDAPEDGLYLFLLTTYTRNINCDYTNAEIYLNGALSIKGTRKDDLRITGTHSVNRSIAIDLLSLTAGDYVEPYIEAEDNDIVEGDRTQTRFMGFRIGSAT